MLAPRTIICRVCRAIAARAATPTARLPRSYLKKREAAEKQLEIELTGTYTNPFAGDVDEIVNPITGEKTKIKKPDSDDDGMGTYKSPNAPKKDGDGDDTPPDASGIDVDDVDDEGKSNIDVLSDLL